MPSGTLSVGLANAPSISRSRLGINRPPRRMLTSAASGGAGSSAGAPKTTSASRVGVIVISGRRVDEAADEIACVQVRRDVHAGAPERDDLVLHRRKLREMVAAC